MQKEAETVVINKKIGGLERAKIAREELILIFNDPTNPLYFSKDIEYAKKFDVTRHTIYSIRDKLGIPPRSERIIAVLKKMKTKDMCIYDISEKLNIKYQNIYKIITDNKISVKKEQ